MEIIFALVVGIIAAMGAGALSGIRIGGAELGSELASYMGMLYGLITGGTAVVIGLVLLALV